MDGEGLCPACGTPGHGCSCTFSDRFDAVMAENPRGRNLQDFVQRLQGEVLHS